MDVLVFSSIAGLLSVWLFLFFFHFGFIGFSLLLVFWMCAMKYRLIEFILYEQSENMTSRYCFVAFIYFQIVSNVDCRFGLGLSAYLLCQGVQKKHKYLVKTHPLFEFNRSGIGPMSNMFKCAS